MSLLVDKSEHFFSIFIFQRKNHRQSVEYALDNSHLISMQHQDNVRVHNARGHLVDVSGSYGAACLSCCLSFKAAKDINLWTSQYFDVIFERGKELIFSFHFNFLMFLSFSTGLLLINQFESWPELRES